MGFFGFGFSVLQAAHFLRGTSPAKFTLLTPTHYPNKFLPVFRRGMLATHPLVCGAVPVVCHKFRGLSAAWTMMFGWVGRHWLWIDRKSTRLNSRHPSISYA